MIKRRLKRQKNRVRVSTYVRKKMFLYYRDRCGIIKNYLGQFGQNESKFFSHIGKTPNLEV